MCVYHVVLTCHGFTEFGVLEGVFRVPTLPLPIHILSVRQRQVFSVYLDYRIIILQ